MVSLADILSDDKNSMIKKKIKIVSLNRAVGMDREYIEFSQLETDYYRTDRKTKNDVIELVDF